MTLQNCETLLAHYKQLMDDSTVSSQVRSNARSAYEDMLANLEAKKAALGVVSKSSKK